ncbi:MAG: VCBS repeat-containing protein, partial [Blastocatellia bacterium]|nr:VCBS repeat-containing protein [Blastocatellia bacterium]
MESSTGFKKLLANKKALIVLCAILVSGLALWFLFGRGGGEVRWVDLNVPAGGKTGFTLLAPDQTGITFVNTLKDEQATTNQLLMDGSGVAAGDFDNDGLCDLYFCRLDGPNVLYKNLGNWKFKDVTAEAGVALPGVFSTGAVFADIDGNGYLDLIVSGFGKLTCFLNEGNGKFKEATDETGLKSNLGSRTLALADIDGDGDLDLYVANHRTTTLKDGAAVQLQNVDGRVVIPPNLRDRVAFIDGGLKEYGEPDILYRNDGDGRFTPVSWTDGSFLDEDGNPLTGPPLDWGLTAMFRDIDQDGDPDIYVCNDYWTEDRIWMNDGEGRFRAVDRLALRNISASAMGVDFSDIDRDGDDDFFVADMLSRSRSRRKRQMPALKTNLNAVGEIDNRPQILRNTLYLNRGDGTYAELGYYGDVEDSEWSWSLVFLDVDLDGFEDLIITNGHFRDILDADTVAYIQSLQLKSVTEAQKTLLIYPRLDTANVAFRNMGNLKFKETAPEWGLAAKVISHGIATADLDNDGDLDLVMNNLGVPAGVYRNDSSAPRIAVRLKGRSPNSQAIGARVTLFNATVAHQSQEIISGGRYLSGSDPL